MSKIPDRTAKLFLAALAEGRTQREASQHAGISHEMAYLWRIKDPEFAAAWRKAIPPRPPRHIAVTSEPDYVGSDLDTWLIREKATIKQAATALGLPERSFYNWLMDDNKFRYPKLLRFRLQYPVDSD